MPVGSFHHTAYELGRADSSGAGAFSHQRGQHTAYLRNWVKAINKDPMAVFPAAKGADLTCEYMLGLVNKREPLADHHEWADEYDKVSIAKRAWTRKV